MVGVPTVTTGVVMDSAVAVPPLRVARIPAAAPPPSSATTTIHRARWRETPFSGAPRVLRALAAQLPGSAMYWKETVPARTCSLEAKMRI